MTRLPVLRRGDTVALVAPAGPVKAELLEAGAARLAALGLRVEADDGVLARHPRFGYLAGEDTHRVEAFQRAWLRPDVAAVFAARGGYGCQRMLDLVDWAALRAAGPTLFCGSSDTTALHAAVSVHLGLPSLFCPMPASTHFDAVAAAHLEQALFAPPAGRVLTGPDAETLVPGRAEGTLVGGNLSLLAAGLGTPEQVRAEGALVLLEDVGEQPYRIDRLLTQLLRAGWFAGVAGIVLGSWTGCGPQDDVRAVLLDRLGPLGVPMVAGFGFGHHQGALTVPLGVRAVLDAGAGTLSLT
ncbi:S66 peptidase family protein [Prauserella muralis]|uniref:LD-carboxypeptidase n=1 Tax=Prauserella muralis TaxID=588067 RepID=A0A2V4AP83_9PSEU|nr:LD-carboxypeptidase [Prauserella muralis]PXY22516.1 LD-carboxypeptidase [Prauserella muralis]TWE28198.1 muramoyltetrapeptide carboxypeptidase [Prauserella muralis]